MVLKLRKSLILNYLVCTLISTLVGINTYSKLQLQSVVGVVQKSTVLKKIWLLLSGVTAVKVIWLCRSLQKLTIKYILLQYFKTSIYWSIVLAFFYVRQKARIRYHPSVCLSHGWIIQKSVEARITKFSPYGSPIPLVIREQVSSRNSEGFPRAGALNEGGVGKIGNFRT